MVLRRIVGYNHTFLHHKLHGNTPKIRYRGLSSDAHFDSLFDQATVTCLPGLEPVLSSELQMLGVQHYAPQSSRKRRKDGKIQLQKPHTVNDLFRCCLYLGTATRVRVRCASFGARGLPELTRKTARIPWNKILKAKVIEDRNLLQVRVVSTKSKLYHTGAIRDRVLQAIGEHFGKDDNYFKETTDKEPNDDEGNPATEPKVLLDVILSEDQVEIHLNSYRTPLHQRGYRKQVAKAPLREDLAYAMLLSAGWTPAWALEDDSETNEDAAWQGLLDPFCGSGTIPIEGAAMMLGLPPGRFRNSSPFEGTILQDDQRWSQLQRNGLDAATVKTTNESSLSISASDRDAGAVEATRANAKRAGVLDAITIERAPLSGQRWFEEPLASPSSFLVVTNPPYGKRISSKASTRRLLTLYQSLGHSIQTLVRDHERRMCGVVLTNNVDLLTRSGVSFPFKTSFKTFHGGLKVSAMKFDAKP